MAGGHMKYRTLSRNSAHRRALLRNLVTSLVKQESIQTTYAKAKEAQRLAEKLITLAKRNNETAKRAAQGILFTPDQLLPKVFGELRERYAQRAGGYTRVLRIEPLNRHKLDQAESAILEFVDGKADTRFTMTAAAVARAELNNWDLNAVTLLNIKKMVRFRKDGQREFDLMVNAIKRKMPREMPLDIEHADRHFEKLNRDLKDYEELDAIYQKHLDARKAAKESGHQTNTKTLKGRWEELIDGEIKGETKGDQAQQAGAEELVAAQDVQKPAQKPGREWVEKPLADGEVMRETKGDRTRRAWAEKIAAGWKPSQKPAKKARKPAQMPLQRVVQKPAEESSTDSEVKRETKGDRTRRAWAEKIAAAQAAQRESIRERWLSEVQSRGRKAPSARPSVAAAKKTQSEHFNSTSDWEDFEEAVVTRGEAREKAKRGSKRRRKMLPVDFDEPLEKPSLNLDPLREKLYPQKTAA